MPDDTEHITTIRQADGPPRVMASACVGGISLERGIPHADISDYIKESENLVWVDVQNPGPEELSMLLEEFGFHPLALEDIAKGQQRPKIDEYKGYLFIVTYAVVPEPEKPELRTLEVDLFIGRNYVVTVHHGRVPAIEDAYARWTRGGEMLREGVGFLVYTLTDAIIDTYFPIVDALGEELDEAEMSMFTERPETSVQRLLEIKRNLFRLRRVLGPLREAFNVLLRRDQPIFTQNTFIYFQDVYDHILRILDIVEIQRDMTTGVLEAHLSVVSNRLNTTMRMLTLVTVVVALTSSLFGAWGMNFSRIPFAGEPWGFWFVFGGGLGLIAASLLVGRIRGWL